jgi:hypothetical protein
LSHDPNSSTDLTVEGVQLDLVNQSVDIVVAQSFWKTYSKNVIKVVEAIA